MSDNKSIAAKNNSSTGTRKKTRGRPKKPTLLLPILEWAFQFGVSEHTLRRKLKGVDSPDGKYSAAQVHAALADDARASRVRLTDVKTKLAQLELRERERDLIPFEEAASFIRDNFVPRREFIVSQSGRLSANINPSDPAHARAILDKDCEQYLKLKEKYPAREADKTESRQNEINHKKTR